MSDRELPIGLERALHGASRAAGATTLDVARPADAWELAAAAAELALLDGALEAPPARLHERLARAFALDDRRGDAPTNEGRPAR